MTKTVEIPDFLYEKIEERFLKSNFDNISDYFTYALRELLDSEINKVCMLMGEVEEEKVCEECGHRNAGDYDYCPYCGCEMETKEVK